MKVYTFECRAHPEAGGEGQLAGVLSFEVRYDGPEATAPTAVKCPLCGIACGAIGPWREVPTDASAESWRSKWGVAIQTWERVATELGQTQRKASEMYKELLALKVAALPAEAKPNVKTPEGIN